MAYSLNQYAVGTATATALTGTLANSQVVVTCITGGTATVAYLGLGTGVTSSNGMPVANGMVVRFDLVTGPPLYAIGSGGVPTIGVYVGRRFD